MQVELQLFFLEMDPLGDQGDVSSYGWIGNEILEPNSLYMVTRLIRT